MSDELDDFLTRWEEPKTRVLAGKQIFSGDKVFVTDSVALAKTPLTIATPVGTFDVTVFQKNNRYHAMQPPAFVNGFLAVEFSANPTVRWEQVQSEKPASVYPTEFECEHFGMSIIDLDTRQKVLAAIAAADGDWWSEWLMGYFPNDITSTAFAYVPFSDGGGFVACCTAWGGGTYPAFLGWDAAGNPTQLVLDFCVRSVKD